MKVVFSGTAQQDFDALPLPMKGRVLQAVSRLERWPEVSGAKWLTANWKGYARIRVGDWRVVFRPTSQAIIVEHIAHRREVYE